LYPRIHAPTAPLASACSSSPQVVEEWEPVTEADVQTPLEVYQELVGGLGWG
jgi:hypothetical protein